MIVLHRGFTSALGKRSREFIEVTGTPAAGMALLQFTIAALAVTWFLRRTLRPVPAALVGFGAILVPPLLYYFLQ